MWTVKSGSPPLLRHQLETQLLQDAENFVGLELLAENAVNFRKMQGDGSQVHLPRDRVDRGAVQFAPRRFENECATRSQALVVASIVGAAFEAMRRIGVQSVPARTLADSGGIEPRGLRSEYCASCP